MIGNDAFCPKTGAPLSNEECYDDRGGSSRIALPGEFTTQSDLPGELTNGAVRSSKAALFNRFRRCHKRHYQDNPTLYRKAALGLHRLKRTAGGQHDDIYVWYALQQWLQRATFDVEWMHAHVEPRCPDCHGPLAYEQYDTGDIHAECGTRCTGPGMDRLHEIRETIADLYFHAFEVSLQPEDFLQFNNS